MESREVREVRVKFDEFLHDTGKAIKVDIGRKEIWLPKYACREITVNKKMGGHVCLPVWLCQEKGINIEYAVETKVITRHVPDKIEAQIIEAPKELRR